VIQGLEKQGIVIPAHEPPFPLPEVTTTLVAGDNQDYLKTNASYLAWLNFILPNIAVLRGALLEVQNEKTHIEATYRQKQREADDGKKRGDRKSTQEVEDAIILDERYVELTQADQEFQQKRYILDAKQESLERTLRVISRHVEVKKLDVEMNRVGMNMPVRHSFGKQGGY
jgi:hypothetical protein